MIDWAAAHFGTGLGAASALRSRVLEALGAEQEWLSREEDEGEDTVSWITGPLATAFCVRPASSLTPGLGVLHISTRCAWVDDLLVAEEMVAALNRNTTVSRWVLRDQPQPPAWSGDDGVPDAVVGRRQVLLPEADPSSTPAVHLELCVVTGEGVASLPLAAVVTAVREQIAKATAVATYENAGFLWSPAFVSMAGRGARGGDTWNDIVYHYDNVVTPAAQQDAQPLLHALTAALSQAQAELEDSGSAVWEGAGDEFGLTCEVPYGDGPFSYGLVGVSYPAHLRGVSHRTSLVQASAINHSQLGRGLMLTLRPGGDPMEDGEALAVALLNQQHSARRMSEAAAHGWGAWIMDGYFMHALFLPAAWATLLDAQDLLQLMRCLLDDTARLSRLSRVVLEPLCDADEDDLLAGNLSTRGLAAGFTARGPEFGEPGAGTAPGARMLAQLWRDLVAGDSQWAELDVADGVGFDYWPNEHRQRFRSIPCTHGNGALVAIETAIPQVSAAPVDHAPGPRGDIGFPGAVVTTADGSAVRSVLHVHDDSMSWIAGWGAPLAVAQALLAAQLDSGSTATKGLQHPVLGDRPQPDQMLELFQPGTPWVESALNPLSLAVLALATSIMEPVPHGARVTELGGVELDWLTPIDTEDMSWAELTTTGTAHQDDLLGPCLLLRTVIAVPDGESAWCATANTWITTDWDGTVVGGFTALSGEATFTSVVPLPLDRSSSTTGHISFVGTCLAHHVDAVRDTVIAVEGASVTAIDVRTLSRGLQSLPHFYRDCGVRSGEVVVVVAESPGTGSAVVTIDRVVNQPLLGTDLWPLLAVNVDSGVGSVLRTRLTIPLTGDLAPLGSSTPPSCSPPTTLPRAATSSCAEPLAVLPTASSRKQCRACSTMDASGYQTTATLRSSRN